MLTSVYVVMEAAVDDSGKIVDWYPMSHKLCTSRQEARDDANASKAYCPNGKKKCRHYKVVRFVKYEAKW